jgi:putative ABC transport system ATP-binding protein
MERATYGKDTSGLWHHGATQTGREAAMSPPNLTVPASDGRHRLLHVIPAIQSEVIVSLHQVGKTYRLGKTSVSALRDVTLDLFAESFTFIVGPSGSGKTTLLNLIGGIDQPTTGTLNVLGHDIGKLDDDALSDFRCRHIGFIFQNFSLIDVLTAYENIEYPLLLSGVPRRERKEIVDEFTAAVGLWDRRDHKPEQLSGGQRQRVAIARALVKKPLLVIADEPTANLDTATSREIIELMQAMQRQYRTTFVFSSHDTAIQAHATRVICMRDGAVESDTRE